MTPSPSRLSLLSKLCAGAAALALLTLPVSAQSQDVSSDRSLCTSPPDIARASGFADSELSGHGFSQGLAPTPTGCLHYVRGGARGKPVLVLVPGWPESWYAWRKLMPELAQTHDVIAFDPPGLGASELSIQGYSAKTASDAIAAALDSLDVSGAYNLLTHDVGTWIGFTHLLDHGDRVRSAVLMEAAVPGLDVEDAFTLDNAPRIFQFFFNSVEELPEMLTRGQAREFLDFFYRTKSVDPATITPADLDVYVRSYGQPERMSAGFGYYRAVPEDAKHVQGRSFAVPVLALGAEKGTKADLVKALRDGPAPQAVGGEVKACGHYMMEECPDAVLSRVRAFHESLGMNASADTSGGAAK